MIIADELLKEHSRRQTVRIAAWIGGDPKRFRELIEAFASDDAILVQRSAWVLNHCAENHPALVTPWFKTLIDRMREPGIHPAIPRNILCIFQTVEIPLRFLGVVVTFCFDMLADPASPIAIKASAMTVLANAARRQPGLVHEIEESIRNITNPSPGIKARARKTLTQLKKLDKR